MRKVVLLFGLAATLMVATACSSAPMASQTPTATQTQAQNLPTVAPSLIPTGDPAQLVSVDAANFLQATGDYVFKVGNGPVWCTISPSSQMSICEQSEVSAQYVPIPIPETCQYSYGYQVELKDTKPTDGTDQAFFPCSGGAFTDPTGALALQDGQSLTVNNTTCFVESQTARCNDIDGAYIVMGQKAWALGQATS